MKIHFIRYLLISFPLFFAACNKREEKLDGAYEMASKLYDSSIIGKDTLRNVTLFKNGYWISTSFTQKSIIKCCGGTFNLNDEHCIQTVYFNSADTSAIGKEYNHEYNSDDKYLITRFAGNEINRKSEGNDMYKKISTPEPLKNLSLEGVWTMKRGQAGYNDNNEIIRIFAFPAFTRTIYNFKEKRFVNTYGGTYQFDGKNLIEKIEYSDYQISPGSTMEWSVKKLTENEIQLFDIDSFNDEEIFDQINSH